MISGIVAGVVILLVLLRQAGNWLIDTDQPAPADLMVVMMGPVPDRALQAVDLFKSGVAHAIVFTDEYQPGAEQLKPFGIELETTAQVFRKALVKLGVPDTAIQILPYISSSTVDEAINLGKFLQDNPKSGRVIVVSSSYHTRRTKMIFKKLTKLLDHQTTFIISPNPYTEFNSRQWWTDRMSTKLLVLEYIKMMNFVLNEQFQMRKQLSAAETGR